ncbi:MAG: DUF4270 domain-containing protein [Bacteroidetes bacterium]|nr:DUF4270 domain-containing protein [Bacteroidota bacterium]MCL2302456.1 DUF4270 domain-containing protein [Lentimicrobiaceae bacterium]
MKNFWNSRRENFNLRLLNYVPFLLLCTILSVSQSCQKEPSSIGLNLKDRDDLLNAIFTDTATLIAYSVLEDTLNTTNLVHNFLGHIKDPIFGTTTAGIYTQLIPSGSNVNFGEAPQLDSIVLTLRYTGGFYGDTANPFTIRVYELTEPILSTTTYNQHSSLAHNGNNLTYNSDFQLKPTPNTRVRLDTVAEAHVRIRLSDDLGHNFLQSASLMATADAFKNFFKGLYICAEPSQGNGSLVNFTLTNALSGIQLYYKDNGTARRFSFIVRSQEVDRFSVYEHNYEIGNSDFVNQVLRNNTLLGEKILYAQSMGGVKTKITFPHLKALKDKNIAVNKAELVITNIGESLHLYPPPARLGISGINSAGINVIIPDELTGEAYFGGSYDAAKGEYRFRVTRYINEIIQRDNFQPSIYLVVRGAAANANRLLLSGTHPGGTSPRLRLEIYYTEY